MPTLDVFNSDAFSAISLTAAIDKVPYQPSMLGRMNLFESVPVRTTTVMVEERAGALALIQTDARGNPPKQRTSELRSMRSFGTVRIAQSDTINAAEFQNIRAFGSETEFMAVQAEVMRRAVGPTGILRNVELTWENMRKGAVQGIVLDADGTTIYNWFTEFNVSQDAEIDFDLDNVAPTSGAVRTKCAQVLRQTARAAQGAWIEGVTQVHALCGDTFWDQLIAHSEIRNTYLNWTAAAELRGPTAWTEGFYYGGIYWHNYRGMDDTVSEPTFTATQAKFFPVNAPGVFQVAWSPAETFDFVNTPGLDRYLMTIPDRDRNSFVRIEMFSYPLFYCTRPKMLQRARNT